MPGLELDRKVLCYIWRTKESMLQLAHPEVAPRKMGALRPQVADPKRAPESIRGPPLFIDASHQRTNVAQDRF